MVHHPTRFSVARFSGFFLSFGSNESPKLYYKSYFARHFYAVLKLWVTGKCMCNIKSIGAFCALVLLPWKLLKFAAISRIKNVFLSNFRTFPNFSKCKALGDFLISFLEIAHLKGCLGGTSRPKFEFLELIWDSRYFPTLALKAFKQ